MANHTGRRHVEPMILLDLPAIRRKLDAGPDRYTLTETAALFGMSRQGIYHTRGLVLPPRDRRCWTRRRCGPSRRSATGWRMSSISGWGTIRRHQWLARSTCRITCGVIGRWCWQCWRGMGCSCDR